MQAQINKETDEIQTSLTTVKSKLAQYHNLGLDFPAIVKEHALLVSKLEQNKWSLQHLQEPT